MIAFVPCSLHAEGSRELIDFEEASGGDARYALTSGQAMTLVPSWTIFEVYLQTGETVFLGSNTLHAGGGNIYLWAPGTPVFTETFPHALFATALVDCVAQAAGDTTVGLIDTRAKELAGPEATPGDGGYVPCRYTATSSGLHPVLFRARQDVGSNPVDQAISDPSIVPQASIGVHAWDATVRDAGGIEQRGRLVAPYLPFYETGGSPGPDQELYATTRDGHRFRLRFDEINGLGFGVFANNKGIQERATGIPTYKTWQIADIDDPGDAQTVHPVAMPDSASDVTHRLSINPIDPVVVTGPGGLAATLGYAPEPQALPLPAGFQFDGTASGGGIGTAPNDFDSATFLFDSDPVLDGSSFSLVVDADRNGLYSDEADRRLAGTFVGSGNSVSFDGRDGLGNPLGFDQIYTARLQGFSGEVHFPLYDVEGLGGMFLERLTALGKGDLFLAAYDDLNGGALTGTIPVSLPEGGDSSVAGFRAWPWSTGNNDLVDTWTFLASEPVETSFVVGAPAADLTITKTDGLTTALPGGSLIYTIEVRNLGPNPEPVAEVADSFPPDLDCAWTSAAA
ncbi:MAG: DUF11 domain-containing protein, partial [Holophagales bacterium]|nr:DUF11 domain-containing protein [Holophagales bacterium]